ncbi:MAG: cell wall hydrolase [Lachnospiraceae bacterium]|nr:cell wall hydrolase [Lachnospiraceae bacterium]
MIAAIQNLWKKISRLFMDKCRRAYQSGALLVSGISVFILVSLHAQEGVSAQKGNVACSGTAKDVRMEQERAANIRMEQEEAALPEQAEGLGGGFISSCQQILEKGEEGARVAKQEQKREREVAAVSASIKPMRNEMRQEPLNPYGEIAITDQDYEALLRIVQAEAGGEEPQGRTLVAEVILNRVLAEQFASSVYDVVFERTGGSPQFAPTADGRFYTVEVTPETVEAVEQAIHGEDLSQGALFFSARSKADKNDMAWFDRNLKWLFQYGGHEFYTLP